MPERLAMPTIVPAAGEPPKEIAEFVGNASTGDDAVSVARMRTEGGWVEPGRWRSSTRSHMSSRAGCTSSTTGASTA